MNFLTLILILFIGVSSGNYTRGTNYLSGFDPIQSKFLSPIFNFTFYQKLSSNIEKDTLVPDQIVERVDPSSTFRLFSKQYTKSVEINDLKDMKISADAKWKSIFGSLNYEKLESSKYFSEHDVNILRIHANIDTYDLILQKFSLIDDVKDRFNEMYRIASFFNITSPKIDYPPAMELLHFQCDNLYRTYGTHHVWRATFGGILALDIVLQTDISNQLTKQQLKAHGSAGFAKIFKIDFDYTTEHSTDTKFKQAIKNQFIKTCGGLPWNTNLTVKAWEDSLIGRPCIIDYDIRPTSDLINVNIIDSDDNPFTKNTFVQAIRGIMIERADDYYHHNTYGGCTSPSANNYLWYANLDDGSCQKENNHQPYGGYWIESNCPEFNTINHDTEARSCRAPFVDSILIQGAFVETGTYVDRVCRYKHFWFFKYKVCHNEQRTWAKTCYETVHQCSYYNTSTLSKGYYVGGMYTPFINNFVTETKSCPPNFHDRIIFHYDQYHDGIHICELGHDETVEYPPGAIKFGGIFNCKVPHPYTRDFKCPQGYTKYSLGSIQACDWWYCIHNSDADHKVYYYPPGYGTNYPDFPFDPFNKKADILSLLIEDETVTSLDYESRGDKHLSNMAVFGIVLGVIIGMLILIAGGIVLYFSMKKPKKESYERIS